MLADPLSAPSYLLDMPERTLLGEARGIERWCARNEKSRPTLLHLALARELIRGGR